MIVLFGVNALLVAAAVLIHYAFLWRMSQSMPWLRTRYSFRVLVGVFGALIAHSVEVLLFAIAYYVIHWYTDWGHLEGRFDGSLLDCVYFSFTTFTTLGYGDVEAVGDIRHLTGLQALTGFVLITWTASFLYLEMQKYWAADSEFTGLEIAELEKSHDNANNERKADAD